LRYIEDDFDIEDFISRRPKNTVPAKKNAFLSFFITLGELALAFTVAYFLFKGGQFVLDIFLK